MSSWFAVFLNCFLIGLVLSYAPNPNLTATIALIGLVSFYFDQYVLVAAFYLILASSNWLILSRSTNPDLILEILPALFAFLLVGAVLSKRWVKSELIQKKQKLIAEGQKPEGIERSLQPLVNLDNRLNLPFIVSRLSLALALVLGISQLPIWQSDSDVGLWFPLLTATGLCCFLVYSLPQLMERSSQSSIVRWMTRLLEEALNDLELIELINPKYRLFPDRRRKAVQDFCQAIVQGAILTTAVFGLLMGVAGQFVR
jgi:hypothetical protein